MTTNQANQEIKTARIERIIASMYCVLDGKDKGLSIPELMDTIQRMTRIKDNDSISKAVGILIKGKQIVIKDSKLVLNDTQANNVPEPKTKKDETMKNQKTEVVRTITTQSIIKDLKSNDKTKTLKSAKLQAMELDIDITDIKTKKDAIKGLNKAYKLTKPAKPAKNPKGTLVVTAGTQSLDITDKARIETEPTEPTEPTTRLAKQNGKRLIAIQATIDYIGTLKNGIDTTTLKWTKNRIAEIFNTKGKKYLDKDVVFSISKANSIRTKAEYKTHLETVLIPALNAAMAEEKDRQQKPENIIIPIKKKAQMLKPDLSILLSQHDQKINSRLDGILTLMGRQDTRIKELKETIECHKNTIALLTDKLLNGGINVAPAKDETLEKTPKKAVKPGKSPEQIQAENREKYINGLKGIEKILFDIMNSSKSALPESTFILCDLLEDFTKKQIKNGLNSLVDIGLFSANKKGYVLAPVSDFVLIDIRLKDDTKPVKPVKTTKKPAFKRGKKIKLNDIIFNVVTTSKKTKQDVINEAQKHGYKASSVKAALYDAKKENLCKFDSLLKTDKKTGVLSF